MQDMNDTGLTLGCVSMQAGCFITTRKLTRCDPPSRHWLNWSLEVGPGSCFWKISRNRYIIGFISRSGGIIQSQVTVK